MLYGWLEVGASNIGVFSSQCNQDIILRTANSNNKIIIGTQIYDIGSGSNMLAGLYVSSNNVGINKVPTSNVQLDINGKFNINNSMTFIESVSGASNQPTYFVNSNNAFYIFYNGSQKVRFTDQQGINISDKVYSTSDFFAPAFNVTSDSNLKREITLTNFTTDAERVEKINVYDYRFYNSTSNVKGFIAQQVEEFFPQAINKALGYIPCSITKVFINNDGIVPKDTLPYDIEVGERIVAKSSGRPCEFIVYKANETHVYISGEKQYMGFIVEVNGKNGFIRTIDTNQLLALSFSTIKDLQIRVSSIEERLGQLLETLSFTPEV